MNVDLSKVIVGSLVFFRSGGAGLVRWIQKSSIFPESTYRGLYFDDYGHCIYYSLSGEFANCAGSWDLSQKHPFDIVSIA